SSALAPAAQERPTRSANAEQQRHRADIGEFQPGIEAVDVLAQRSLHLTQISANGQHLSAEPFDGLPLFICQDDRFAFADALELGELILQLLELRRQRLLLLAIAALRIAADFGHELEWPVDDAAATQREQS